MTIPATPYLGVELTASARALKRDYERVYRGVYIRKGAQLTAADRAVAAWLWSGRSATMAGSSAAALHGAKWVDAKQPAEMFRRNGKPVKRIVIHRDELLIDERQRLGRIWVSTPARTAFDLGRRRGRTLAVVRVDALANATRLRPESVEALIERHAGVRGLVQLRDVVALMDGGAESPQETRTRLMLIDAGLPRPQPQIAVGRWRIDMGDPEFKVGVEYDGEQHWTNARQHASDIDRLAELLARGWLIIRVSATMLRENRDVILRRTCQALRQAGAEWPVIERLLRDLVA